MEEMRKVILAEVSTLEATMWKLYEGFPTVYKVDVHLYSFQQWSNKIVQSLKDIDATITHVQEWTMRYKGASPFLHNMMKPWKKS